MKTFAGFIDIRKAYDTVWRDGLWFKMREAGVDEHTIKMMQAMTSKVLRTVLINDDKTAEFEVTGGVPQGSVLSPLLYAIFINGLDKALRAKGLGARVYGRLGACTTLLGYLADCMGACVRTCC